MSQSNRGIIVATGFAMFSMFFGAGNVVFPLGVGQIAHDNVIFATGGLLLTAILIPFLGLMAMMLFDGDYDAFFERLGKIPGALSVLMIVLLIGPGGATPRCITLSYATVTSYFGYIDIRLFSLIACGIVFTMTYRPTKILDILGYYLTPILLASLATIIVLGLADTSGLHPSTDTPTEVFISGLTEGYLTMDMLGAFFFSHVVLMCLKREVDDETANDPRKLLKVSFQSSMIGAVLLAVVYCGFCATAAFHSDSLVGASQDQLLAVLAVAVLGSKFSIAAVVAVALACLTTAIALVNVFSEYLEVDILRNRLPYLWCLIITLVATYFVSTLEFDGIKRFLGPILVVLHPALIVLSICNLLYKLYDFQIVKTPVAATFAASLWYYTPMLKAWIGIV